MVRSMINLTTLPLSFWDYALESVARILNMVPTKKVDKTPYELWFGKVPNLSYLKVWGCEALVKKDTPDKLQQKSVKVYLYRTPKGNDGLLFLLPTRKQNSCCEWRLKFHPHQEGRSSVRRSRRPIENFLKALSKGNLLKPPYGVDYEETFSPIADIRAIMILIAIAAFYDYEIWQMDVKTAF
ncbi:retrotransposon protein, putative, ty1-copia subclass [Tanacetum coccineum]